MALTKQGVDLPFSKGLDTKTDPFRVPFGNFLAFRDAVFEKGGLLTKRNGYGQLASLPNATNKIVTTFNGNLTAVGTALLAYNQAARTWVNKGSIVPVDLSVLSLIRSNTNQTQSDAAVSSNGLVCTVYTDVGTTATTYKYAIADVVTGQNLTAPTTITAADATYGTPKVFVLGNYFIIVFTNKVSSTYHLKYIAISTVTLAAGSDTDISTNYTPATSVAFDGVVANNSLYVAWNGADGGGAIHVTYLDATLTQHGTVNFATRIATTVSCTADTTGGSPIIWVTVNNSATQLTYTLAVDSILSTILAPTAPTLSPAIVAPNITSSAQNGICTVLIEYTNAYSFDSTIPSNYIQKWTVTQAGVVGGATTVDRSVGLASKSFIQSGTIYLWTAYQSSYQPTYFLIDTSGNVITKLAYSNGGGYLTKGLPNVSSYDGQFMVPYLFKDLVEPVNKIQGATTSAPVYSQTGINLAKTTIATGAIATAEIGNNLHLSGGFLWSYDGYTPVEHNFHLFPDSVKLTAINSLTPTVTTTSGNAVLTAVSSTANVNVGMNITGAGIQASTVVLAYTSNTITMSKTATASATVTATLTGNMTLQQYFYQVLYEWTDLQGNIFRSAPSIPLTVTLSGSNTAVEVFIPTLRLTYKTANPVKISIFRWSTAQQSYFQTTSILAPLLNDTTIDSVEWTDYNADSAIVGNSLIYTTGGVVEDIAAPACKSIDLFDTRMWLIDAEDENLLWFSKQVIQGVPVEWSDLFTYFVPPTTGAEGSTGPCKVLFPMDDKQIIWKPSAIYYINGTGPDNAGQNNQYSPPTFITATVGTSNAASLVFQPEGIMFQADGGKGIWLLGRDLSTKYIGAPVEEFNDATVESAVAIPGTNQVRFNLDNGVTLMYDYYYGQWGSFSNIPALYSTIYQSLHTYMDDLGRVFQETPGLYLDGANPVLMSFTTSWVNLAGLQGYQRAYFFYLLGTYISPHKLTLGISYDYQLGTTQTVTISPDNFTPVYGGGGTASPGTNPPYGSDPVYGGASNVEQWRVFLEKGKCQAFQISLQETYDPSFGVPAGAGLTLSGLNLVVGVKKGYSPIRAANSVG